jgi:hypothetical protein
MKITNSKTLTVENTLDITEDTIGIVVKDQLETENNAVGIFIPRFMFNIKTKEKDKYEPYEEDEELDLTIVKNAKFKKLSSTTVNTQNYLIVPFYTIPGMSIPMCVKGERKVVTFIDRDIKSPIIYPYEFDDIYKRKTDIQRFQIVSKPDEIELPTKENTYFLELDSTNKKVTFHTSNANEEKCPFTYEIDTENGIVTFKDDSQRLFEWNYDEDRIEHMTDEGLSWKIEKMKATLLCDDFEVTANNTISMTTTELLIKAEKGTFEIGEEVHTNTSYAGTGDTLANTYGETKHEGDNIEHISSGPVKVEAGSKISILGGGKNLFTVLDTQFNANKDEKDMGSPALHTVHPADQSKYSTNIADLGAMME